MSKRRIRWGILSTAQIGRNVFIPALRRATGGSLVAVASRDRSTAEEFAAELGIPRVFSSYEALLGSDEIDAVYIPLPNTLHEEWTIKAADQGKHVFCEKPLATTAAAGRRMVEHCRSKGVQLFEAFVFLHHPQTLRLQRLLASGQVGELRQLEARLAFFLQRPTDNIRLVKELGGGSVFDVGSYPITFARCMFGREPVSVHAELHTDREYQVDTRAAITLGFGAGRTATLQCSFDAAGGPWASLLGEDGFVHVPQPYHPREDSSYSVHTRGAREEVSLSNGGPPFTAAIESFHHAIHGQAPQRSADYALGTLKVIEAVFDSARTGRTVKLGA